MNIQTISIERINAAAYNPRIDLQPGDPEYEKYGEALSPSATSSPSYGTSAPAIW